MVKCLGEKFVDRTLKDFFYWLGCKIGESPGYFLVVPLLLTALCISGFQQMDYEFEPEYLGCLSFPIRSYSKLLYQLLSLLLSTISKFFIFYFLLHWIRYQIEQVNTPDC